MSEKPKDTNLTFGVYIGGVKKGGGMGMIKMHSYFESVQDVNSMIRNCMNIQCKDHTRKLVTYNLTPICKTMGDGKRELELERGGRDE